MSTKTKSKGIRTAYIHLSKEKVETTQEILGGKIFADFDAAGHMVGFEFIDPLSVEVNGELQ